MKLTRIAFAIGALMTAGSASAFDVYVGGATALRDTMPRFLNQFCDAAPRQVYRFSTGAGFDNDRRVFTCNLNAAAGPALAGKPIRMFHSVEPGDALDNDLGGSITGVVPLLYTNNDNARLNYLVLPGETINGVVGACVADGTETDFGGAPRSKCTSQTKRADTEVGVSDVEARKFTAAFENIPTAAIVPAEWKNFNPNILVSTPIFATVFGVAATDVAIANGITDLSHDQLAALLSGEIATWDQLGFPALAGDVRVCRRTPGSGTQATFNQRVSGRGCGSPSYAQETAIADEAGFFPTIDENNTTSAVKKCLVDHNTAGRSAIGIMSLENRTDEAGWDIIEVDGVDVWNAAGVGDTKDGAVDNVLEDKVISGEYPLYVESTVQFRPGLAGDQKAFHDLIRDKSGLPSITLNLPGIISLASQKPNAVLANQGKLNGGHHFFTRNGETCNASVFNP